MSVIGENNTSEGKSCCDIVKVNSADDIASYLADKIQAGTYIIFTVKDGGTTGSYIEVTLDTDALSGEIVAANDKVAVASGDTAGYLYSKLADNPDGTIKKYNNGSTVYFLLEANITDLEDVVSSSESNLDLLVYNSTSEKWENESYLESTFSGSATKIPLSSAMKTLLQTLTITDADDIISGNAIMYDKEDVDASRIMIVDKNSTNFVSHYPAVVDLVAAVADFRTSATTAALTGWDRSVFGNVEIGSEEGDDEDADTFVAALINFTLDEDFISGGTIYLDVMLKLIDSSGDDYETKLKAFPYYVQDGNTAGASLTAVEETISWNENGNDTYEWHTFQITGPTADTKPTPMAVFLACLSNKGTFSETGVNYTTIVCARVRYLKKTIQLRTDDVSM